MSDTITPESTVLTRINANSVYYRDLNALLREAVAKGAERIEIYNVHGQRYIGTDLDRPVQLTVYGTPGNDLGAFMEGPRIVVYGNAQDGLGNTMNGGEIVVHGRAGDIAGFSMRGGRIFVRDGAGYRVGIHMKEYRAQRPVLIIGGTAQHFLGEYMAGGTLIVLGLNLKEGEAHPSTFVGTGMHGGVIYLRGHIQPYQLGKEVKILPLDKGDRSYLEILVGQFAAHFGFDAQSILAGEFVKLLPLSVRPYGQLYAY